MYGEAGHKGNSRGSIGPVAAAMTQQHPGRRANSRYARTVQDWAMRWHDGNPAWVHERFGWFDPDDYGVDLIDRKTAVEFIARHHYSRSVPALRRYRFGLFCLAGDEPALVGVAALSVPARNEVLSGPLPDLEPNEESAELGRLIILDHVPRFARRSPNDSLLSPPATPDPEPHRNRTFPLEICSPSSRPGTSGPATSSPSAVPAITVSGLSRSPRTGASVSPADTSAAAVRPHPLGPAASPNPGRSQAPATARSPGPAGNKGRSMDDGEETNCRPGRFHRRSAARCRAARTRVATVQAGRPPASGSPQRDGETRRRQEQCAAPVEPYPRPAQARSPVQWLASQRSPHWPCFPVCRRRGVVAAVRPGYTPFY